MTHEQKKQVKDALVRYMSTFSTQTEAAATLHGISLSTISQVKNHNWDLLSDRLWHHIAKQVGFYCGEWCAADTSAYLLLRILMGDAQHYGMAYGIAIGNGIGKTFSAAQYAREHENVIYAAGNSAYNRKSFLSALLAAAGKNMESSSPEMLDSLAGIVAAKDMPLLIVDDAHLLKDRVLHVLVLLANKLSGKVGLILMGNDTLRTRIVDGVRLRKPGFTEIYKTIGKRFITLGCLAPGDVAAVCQANGIHDRETIDFITEASNSNLHTAACLISEQTQQRIAA